MQGLELKLIFKNSQGYLTDDIALNFTNYGLNDHVINFQSHAYWIVRVISFNNKENRVFCEILSYRLGQTDFEPNQKQMANKLSQIEYISFNKIDTTGLLSTLLKIKKNPLKKPIVYKTISKNLNFSEKPNIERKPEKIQINKTFYYPLKHIDFNNGYVSFGQKFQEYEKVLDIIIENQDIIEEYDAVKDYFENILATKDVKIMVSIEIVDNKVISSFAESPDINKIDKKFIEEVKFNIIKSKFKNKANDNEDNDFFTLEDFYKDNIELKSLYENEEELFENSLIVTNSKHYRHLRHLSKIHSHNLMKIRCLKNPFSYIFLIKGNSYYYFIWETLKTEEATYIWRIENEVNALQMEIKTVNDIIKKIKTQGKMSYISSTNDEFMRIFHNYDDSHNGFIKWKNDLERILI